MGSQSQSSMDVRLLIPPTLLGTDYLACQSNRTAQVQCKNSVFFIDSLFKRKSLANLTEGKKGTYIFQTAL